jgi:hypothetical protein
MFPVKGPSTTDVATMQTKVNCYAISFILWSRQGIHVDPYEVVLAQNGDGSEQEDSDHLARAYIYLQDGLQSP